MAQSSAMSGSDATGESSGTWRQPLISRGAIALDGTTSQAAYGEGRTAKGYHGPRGEATSQLLRSSYLGATPVDLTC